MMASKLTKKGKNPGAVDNWLDTLGLYRKNVAYDETCLFRAVSEQLFDCQIYHERVRRQCLAYARLNYREFTHFVDSKEKWQDHLDMLEKHMVVCGKIEIDIISKLYNRDVIIFDAAHQKITEVTKLNLPHPLLLCLMDEDHFDVVYKKEHIVAAGFCQSIIYKILYEEVFEIPNVDDIVKAMLYDKNHVIMAQNDLLAEKKKTGTEINNNEMGLPTVEEVADGMDTPLLTTNIAPFPFKVAKALDPTIYRNIEYDSWGEVRREMRLGDWYYGDNKLILGTRCILNVPEKNEMHDCYIQEIIKDQNKCIVYLTQLAERRTVNYTDLSPENDAKPWPLPYRFSKNLIITGSPQLPPVEKVSKTVKKRNKDKRRTKSCSESSPVSSMPASTETMDNVNAYVGIPLVCCYVKVCGFQVF
ncbi:hypothetical protein NQ318_009582 [Aromia moschata]|uniref:OTU domain-containing protein n=1 Tax=Aromia moschata TaxID=1265417 RepID=A0AAV8Y2Y4_9CUCU|nr:hypothetical protein NQ318_009582 [Aromia moschata]